MAGKLLILTFHATPGLLAEDLRFKSAALASGLIAGDAMDASADGLFAQLAAQRGGGGSGLQRGRLSDGTQLVTLNQVGAKAWSLPAYRKPPNGPSVFEQWLTRSLSESIECLVLGGHHSRGIVWGAERQPGASGHMPYTALVPEAAGSQVTVAGYVSSATDAQLLAGPFDIKASLRRCRLVVIFGCNGAVLTHAQPWRDLISRAGKPPLILGWYGTHRMPRDAFGEHVSFGLWERLRALATGQGVDLPTLCEHHAQLVIEAWASALKDAFSNSKHCQQHLWFSGGRHCKGDYGPRGGGAIAPDGRQWAIDRSGAIKPVG